MRYSYSNLPYHNRNLLFRSLVAAVGKSIPDINNSIPHNGNSFPHNGNKIRWNCEVFRLLSPKTTTEI